MPEGIFLIKDDGLVKMEESKYDSEDLLQSLLEKYPDLLAGEQINQDNPRRWILISREMELSSEEVTNRWSVDHLFLDQDGIPTLVEVKRSTDTRIRREVVGQMMDYAANSLIYWPVEKIRSKFENLCSTKGSDPETAIINLVGDDHDPEDFWNNVKTNLQAGKIRLVFVADVIPSELKRIVEFLNEQMDPAEVLAIEIKQFIGEGLKSLVPRVIGQTQGALKRKGKGERKPKLNENTFFEAVDENGESFFKKVLDFSKEKGLIIHWGTTGFSLNVDLNGVHVAILYGYSTLAWFGQSVQPGLSDILKKVQNSEELVNEFNADLFSIGIFRKTQKGLTLDLKEKPNPETEDSLIRVLDWIVGEIKKNN